MNAMSFSLFARRHAHAATDSVCTATVETGGGKLPLRVSPEPNACASAMLPDGALLSVLDRQENWFSVRYRRRFGYVPADYIVLNY